MKFLLKIELFITNRNFWLKRWNFCQKSQRLTSAENIFWTLSYAYLLGWRLNTANWNFPAANKWSRWNDFDEFLNFHDWNYSFDNYFENSNSASTHAAYYYIALILGLDHFGRKNIPNRNINYQKKFWPKIEVLTKNGNFGQRSKFWPKIKILAKNRNFDD